MRDRSADGGPAARGADFLLSLHRGQTFDDWTLEDVSVVGYSTAGVNVTPALYDDGERQYVAFYDVDRALCVASRTLGGEWWTTVLDTKIGADSHNYPAIAVDDRGHVHVAANMHSSELIYYRSAVAGDTGSLRRLDVLIDAGVEARVTYPHFIHDADGALWFAFRSGGSGAGSEILYRYDSGEAAWTNPAGGPVVDGAGTMSPYFDANGPILGPDGKFHLLWVWRDSPDADTNHTISYARSTDLRTWTDSWGNAIALPVRPGLGEVVHDVPTGCGLLNNNVRLGFTSSGSGVVVYHRRDSGGRMQICGAVRGDGGWIVRQITDWEYTWEFDGLGSLEFALEIGRPEAVRGTLVVEVRRGQQVDVLTIGDDLDLLRIDRRPVPWPPAARPLYGDGTQVNWDRGKIGPGVDSALEDLVLTCSVPVQRDKPLVGDEPHPSPVVVVRARSTVI